MIVIICLLYQNHHIYLNKYSMKLKYVLVAIANIIIANHWKNYLNYSKYNIFNQIIS